MKRLKSGLIIPDKPADSAGFLEGCRLDDDISIFSLMKNYKSLKKTEKDWIDYYFSIGTNHQDYLDFLNGLVWEFNMPTPAEVIDPDNGYLSGAECDSLFPHIKEAFVEAMNTETPFNYIVSYGSTRCEGKGTEILMYDLSVKKIEDIQVGDKLMGDDGFCRNVLELHRGYGQLYKVKQKGGKSYFVNENHILTLWNSSKVDIPLQSYFKIPNAYKNYYYGVKAVLENDIIAQDKVKLTEIIIRKAKKGEYFGFALDGNQRYLHSDLTITHNTGKSKLAHLFVFYTTLYINYLKSPQLYFGKSPDAELSLYLVSFKVDKTNELLLTPILKMFDASPMFKRERFENKVRSTKMENGIIPFSEASKFADITFPKFSIASGSSPSDYVGGNIIAGVISELLHFRKFASVSDEDVMKVFSELYGRIKGTVGYGKKFPAFVYLDSSANDADSKVEKYITNELRQNKSCYYKDFIRWEVLPELFPEWANANKKKGEVFTNPSTWSRNELGVPPWSSELRIEKTFKVCIGSGDIPAFVVDDDSQIENITKNLIINVPIDAWEDFRTDLIGSIHNIAGKASSSDSKFIPNREVIDNIFDSNLVNMISEIICGTEDDPEKLLWNRLHRQFFVNEGSGFRLKRAPREVRFLSLDLAKSYKGDLASVSMTHKELKNGRIVIVTDFTLVFAPDKKGINLEAINRFIIDLMTMGAVVIKKLTADRALSDTMMQNLDRAKVTVKLMSVDTSLDPYLNLLSHMYNETVLVGKNIFLKNNLDSLHRVKQKNGKEKIDHMNGKTVHNYNGNWELSEAGKNDKDASDAWCGAVYLATIDDSQTVTNYGEENKRLMITDEVVDTNMKEAYMIEKFRKIQATKLGAVIRKVR